MSRLNWINCSRLRKYEPASVVDVQCKRCKHLVYKDQAWEAKVRGGKHTLVWCTSCVNNDHQPALFD